MKKDAITNVKKKVSCSPDIGHRVTDQLKRWYKEMFAKIRLGEEVYCNLTQVQIAKPVPVASTLSKLLSSEEKNSLDQLQLLNLIHRNKQILLFYLALFC